jgi:hypothetical protein
MSERTSKNPGIADYVVARRKYMLQRWYNLIFGLAFIGLVAVVSGMASSGLSPSSQTPGG